MFLINFIINTLMSKQATKKSIPIPITNKPISKLLQKQNMTELQNVRILQKNLVYVIGLSSKIAKSEVKINSFKKRS